MKVVSIASPKGGVGKSSITALLAVTATMENKRAAIIDLNSDQANLSQWWILRGEPQLPYLVQDLEDLADDIEVLSKAKFDWVFIDTPPLNIDVIDAAVSVSNAVVIPGKPSVFDIAAIEPLIEICRARRRPHALLLSDVDLSYKSLNASAAGAYAELAPMFETRLSHRSAYANALTNGLVGPEIDKTLKLEAQALWLEVQRLASAPYSSKIKSLKPIVDVKHV
jgi:chromosome partitioning protein